MNIATTDRIAAQTPGGPESSDTAADSLSTPAYAECLTGLPNRIMLNWYLDYVFALPPEPHGNVAMLVIELSDMRVMRHSFDDIVCDRFEQITARRIRDQAKPGHFVSRVNSGEFVFVLSRCSDREECIAIAKRIYACLETSIQVGGKEYFSSANIGIAIADFESGSPANLFQRAQAALERARLAGPGQHAFAEIESTESQMCDFATDRFRDHADNDIPTHLNG